jgi:mannose-6-phosphate isomerase-like protein (cupin superfamily)
MLKATFSKADATQTGEGAVFRHPIFSPEQVAADLEHGWVFLKPGQATAPHCRARVELYVVYDGQGRARVAKASAPIKDLDAILIPPNAEHHVENTGERDLTIFWAAWKPVAPVEIGTDRVAVAPFERERLKPAHLGTFYHWEPFSTKVMGGPDRFTTGWGLVGGGVASELHNHPTGELYVFFRGAAVQQVGLECTAVKATDSVMVPADTLHNLLNYTDQELLLYWIEVIPGSLPE